jgi:hypothetical protein
MQAVNVAITAPRDEPSTNWLSMTKSRSELIEAQTPKARHAER